MLGVDTHVLVRYLTRDDHPQYEKAPRLIDHEVATGEPVLMNLLVLMGTEWVLRSRYAMELDLIAAFSALGGFGGGFCRFGVPVAPACGSGRSSSFPCMRGGA